MSSDKPVRDWGYQVREEPVKAAMEAWADYQANPGDSTKHRVWMAAEHELTTCEHTEYIRRYARLMQEKNS